MDQMDRLQRLHRRSRQHQSLVASSRRRKLGSIIILFLDERRSGDLSGVYSALYLISPAQTLLGERPVVHDGPTA